MLKFNIVSCVLALMMSISAYAKDTERMLLNSWYKALLPVDGEVISTLLAEDAMIELKDYDIVQSKSEFIDSLDSWKDAIDGGSIKYKMSDHADGNVITAIVCYTFASNQLMTEETFRFSNEKIMNSVQVTIGEDCMDF